MNAISSLWTLAEEATDYVSIAVTVDQTAITRALNRIKVQTLDGYDLLMVDAVLSAGITQVLTDDGDFGQVPAIEVFTANQSLLKATRSQGKLVKR